jgi:hypothetical protein
MCHTRELAYQIKNEYDRFSKHMDNVRTEVFFGGIPYVLYVWIWVPGFGLAFMYRLPVDLALDLD